MPLLLILLSLIMPKGKYEQSKQNKLYSMQEAADYLGLKVYTLKNLFYANDMQEPVPTKLRGRLFFTEMSLDKMVNDNTVQHRR